jgi:hypothetical protein
MRQLILIVLVAAAMTSFGCKRSKPVAKDNAPLVPTAAERAVLQAFQLQPDSARGQRKLRELRANQKRLDEADATARSWVEEAQKRRAAEAAAEEAEW